MPITPTNVSKNSITPAYIDKGGYALWDDTTVSWDDSVLLWDSYYYNVTNISKNSITPANISKN